MAVSERRKYARTNNTFRIRVKIARTSNELEGITQNVSQGGAFISSPSWPLFQENDQAEMRIFLPPEFTGQRDTLTLTGPGVLKRIEEDKQGVAFEFLRQLKTFEPSL
jgi:hypothetical protein